MYSTDPQWCNRCWKHVGELECLDCLQWLIGYRINDILLGMFLRGWKI